MNPYFFLGHIQPMSIADTVMSVVLNRFNSDRGGFRPSAKALKGVQIM